MFRNFILICLISILFTSCCCIRVKQTQTFMHQPFEQVKAPPAPDYSQSKNWAALPNRNDACDQSPDGKTDTSIAQMVDVFWIHPTTFTQAPKQNFCWNADVNDVELNLKTDNSTILYQASAFNSAGKIYAPRYRQAHLYAFFTPDKSLKRKALRLAYEDIKTSFEFYLKNYNHGRPIIIASHSQGGLHAFWLLRDYFANQPLMKQLVAAYIIGMPIPKDSLNFLLPCKDSSQTKCYLSWYTFKENYYPPNYNEYAVAYCVNPLSWNDVENNVGKQFNEGAVIKPFGKIKPKFVGAKVNKGLLWIKSPFPFLNIKNYHIGDINLFYMNVKPNAAFRSKIFLQRKN